tara:strand:+ start:622 stop:1656 length:1035 start_codon:yes stop_codon:yes gene_type:complete
MSTLKVDAIRHNSATSDAITTASDGTCTAKITNYPHRNLFLNGAVNISQRGDSYASAYTYKADQWYIFPTGSTTTRLTTSPPDGFTYYFRFPSATNSIIISQQIELEEQGKVGKYKNKTVTVSWYARSESSNKMYVDAAFKNASGGGDYTTIVAGSGSPQDITSSWARYSQTFTISATPHANNKCFSVMIRTPSSGSGSTGTLEATGFQCEFGDTATDFEHIAIAEDLSRCLRYYELIAERDEGSNAKENPIGLFWGDGSNSFTWVSFKEKKRAQPTLEISNYTNAFRLYGSGGGVNVSTMTANSLQRDGMLLEVSGNAGTAGFTRLYTTNNGLKALVAVSAEI